MYPVLPLVLPLGLAVTGFATMAFLALGVTFVLLGLVLVRAATVRLDPDARR